MGMAMGTTLGGHSEQVKSTIYIVGGTDVVFLTMYSTYAPSPQG